MSFDKKNIPLYFGFFLVVIVVSQIGSKIGNYFDKQNDNDEYDLIRKYLLNDSPLVGYNKPKLWVHTKYERNSRFWKSFGSTSSYDLNQPYIHLCVKSIIENCGDSFDICLIDDESFSKLIPNFNTKIVNIAEPFRSNVREYAMALLLYSYGGMIVPNSFICMKNLKELYEKGTSQGKPFVLENINHGTDVIHNKKNGNKRMTFVPDTFFMGALKNDPSMRQLLEYLKSRNLDPHFSSVVHFFGSTSQWLVNQVNLNNFTLIGGEIIGTKSAKMKPILVEDLMEEQFLDLYSDYFGVYIPDQELLKRIKYQWFPVLSSQDVLKTTTVISKYLKASMVTNINIEQKIVKAQITSF